VSPNPDLSVVIPVHNEATTLEDLHHRLSQTLKSVGRSYEIIVIDDGSTDASAEILRLIHARDRDLRVVRLNRNYGQHAAVFAGLERARGAVVITLDADLQNPPEEIPALLQKIDEGYDVVGGWRESRRDPLFRRAGSILINRLTSWIVGVPMRDYGCMLRAYQRSVVDQLLRCQEISSFIPALANCFATRVTELPVAHHPRQAGRSRYGLFRLLRLCFDLLTGFSLLPIQVVSLSGVAIAVVGLAFALFLGIRRLVVGPEVEGLFTLFAILFFFVGLQILALGLIGEYVGRIYQEVRRRPRYVVSEVWE
jgi:undecaprenyl-phosphate 4-deoxy-4-formamido-L-arabinose transferase